MRKSTYVLIRSYRYAYIVVLCLALLGCDSSSSNAVPSPSHDKPMALSELIGRWRVKAIIEENMGLSGASNIGRWGVEAPVVFVAEGLFFNPDDLAASGVMKLNNEEYMEVGGDCRFLLEGKTIQIGGAGGYTRFDILYHDSTWMIWASRLIYQKQKYIY